EAEDSIFFGVAKALVNRQVVLADFQPQGLQQPETVQLAARMRYSIEPELGHAGIVEIATVSGQRYSCRVDKPLGDHAKPLSDAQLVAKFRDCAQRAANGLGPQTLDEILALVDHLERVSDVSQLTALLRGAAPGRPQS